MKFSLVLTVFAATTLAIPQGGRGGFRGGNDVPQPGGQGQVQQGQKGQQGQQPPQGQQAPNAQGAAPPPPAGTSAPAATASNVAPPAQTSAAAAQGGNQGGAQTAASGAGGDQGPVNPAQVPDFGVTAGQNNVDGSCDGSVPGVKIPCDCPPSKDAFIPKLNEFLAAGQVPDGTKISFPTSDSVQDQITRAMVTLNVLQNFSGNSGVGCPASSTTLLKQIMALQTQQ
ncbi:MAG: hypothetical protein MMC23_004673 [Stictis urceolatum]|nr:hypothetical protein [Stictis urceolata]